MVCQLKYFANLLGGALDRIPPSPDDPKLKLLYGNMPEQQWLKQMWLSKLVEVIDAGCQWPGHLRHTTVEGIWQRASPAQADPGAQIIQEPGHSRQLYA